MANVQENVNKIRTAVYGEEVRGAIANSIEAMNEEASTAYSKSNTTATEQAALQKKFDEQIKNMTLKDPSSAEIVAAREDENNNSFDTVGARMNYIDNRTRYKDKETKLISKFYKNLSVGNEVKIVFQGDSLIYGVDRNSSDKRKPKSDPTQDSECGDTSECQASVTLPEAIQKYCDEIYGSGKVTVINRGYSGDWAEKSYERWSTNPNADVVFLRLGSNDSYTGATWIPSGVVGNMEKYTEDMRKIIERYLDWGTAVILMTPPRAAKPENFTSGYATQAYRNAIKMLSDEYSCPVIPCENHMNGCDKTYYSDGVHMTGKGYSHDAAQTMAFLIGFINQISKVNSGSVIGIRKTRDNFIEQGDISFLESSASSGACEYTSDSGMTYEMKSNSSIYYSIETLEDNLVLIPIFYNSSGKLQVTLDFGTEQGSFTDLSAVEKRAAERYKAKSVIETTISSNSKSAWNGTINPNTENQYLVIANKGYHTIQVKNIGTTADCYLRFNGFITMSYKEFCNRYETTLLDGGRKYEILTHTSVSDNTNVTESLIDLSKLLDALRISISGEYWKNPVLKIQVQNFDEAILEYIIQVGNTTVGSTSWKFGLNTTVNLIQNPEASKMRTITAVSLEKNNILKLTYGGATSRATRIVITKL